MDFAEMAKDEYNTEEERKTLLNLDSLERQAHAGALFEDFKRHPAWKKVEEYIDGFIAEGQKAIFSDPDGDHRKMIFQVQGMVRIKNWINIQALAGQIASKGIADHFKEVAEEKKALGLE